MRPITFSVGLERYLLVRRGTTMEHGEERVSGARAYRILEPTLRSNSRLVRDIATVLRLHGTDREIADRLIANLRAHGSVGGNLVLMRERPAEAPRVSSGPIECVAPPEPLMSEPEPVCEDVAEEDPPPARTSVRISVFFDGTGNNRANTRARLNATTAYADHGGDGSSYDNDFTNVSRLETLYTGDPNFDHSFSIYVEGIGTVNHGEDEMWDSGTGMGDTGVVAKVTSGVNHVLRTIRTHIDRGVTIERLHIDAFGFSRGAAAARNFVHVVLHGDQPLQGRIEAGGRPVQELVINFLGLFDTVASYGTDHTNDTSDLHLDAIRVARKVVHLAAGEEHRENFPLTTIASAIRAGVGVEIHLPGVHSDVGGGYANNFDEVDLQVLDLDGFSDATMEARFRRERTWLIDAGWCTAAEVQDVGWWNELRFTRNNLQSHYNRIPLKHMANFATQAGLTFDSVDTHHPIPSRLNSIRDTIAAHVDAVVAGTTTSSAAHWIGMRGADFQVLRNRYLHFSAKYGVAGMAPHFTGDDPMTGTRQRLVYAG